MTSLDADGWISIQYQNANNSVRVTDEFMRAVVEDKDWHLRAVTTGDIVATYKARDILRQVAEAAWECGDPGVQYDTTINDWHTCPNSGRINASNPCFTGDTLVLTNKGYVLFRDLLHRVCEGEEFRIATDNITSGGQGVALTTPECFMVTGYKAIYRRRRTNP
jgi:ribonucleoside-diphosphate reductase alpha chain